VESSSIRTAVSILRLSSTTNNMPSCFGLIRNHRFVLQK
jgi:hypothetical protein